jgi:hypothetical protein
VPPALPPGLRSGELDLLPHLEPRYRAELAHGLLHLGLVALLGRVTATRWTTQSTRHAP